MHQLRLFEMRLSGEGSGLLARRRYAILLAALVVLILANPIAETASQARFVVIGGAVIFMLACLQSADTHVHLRRVAQPLVLVWLVLNLPLPGLTASWAVTAASVLLIALCLILLWLVAHQLVQAERVDGELLCGAVAAYLLFGVFWAETYNLINFAVPGAFAESGGRTLSKSALIYFSFTTLTTTGYGDITPVLPLVRMWSVFEAIIGTIYNATVIARLVSLYGVQVRRQD